MNPPDQTSEWLESIGLGELSPVFAAQNITMDIVGSLTEDDLKNIGIESLGHRKKLLTAITALSTAAPQTPPPSLPPPTIPQPTYAPGARNRPLPRRPGVKAPRPMARVPKAKVPAAKAPVVRAPVAPAHPAVAQTYIPQPDVPHPAIHQPVHEVAEMTEEAIVPVQYEVPAVPARKRKLFSGSFLAVSIAVHVILGLGAGYFVVQRISAKRKLQFAEGPPTVSASKRALEHQVSMQKKKNSGGAPAQAKRIAVAGAATKITLPEMPAMPTASTQFVAGRMAGMGGAGFGTGLGIGNGSGMGVGGGFGNGMGLNMLPPSLKGRCSDSDRIMNLAKNGGSAKHEEAVNRTLDWLKSKQNADGSWGQGYKGAMTGFALLCYLGRCVTPDDPKYGDNVMKGILYLVGLSQQNSEGLIASKPETNGGIYEHGIATYALGEMYTLARLGRRQLPGMREAFEKGVIFIVSKQRDDGGWRYLTREGASGGSSDLSVSGWQYQALKAAHLSDLKIRGVEGAIKNLIKYIQGKQNLKGTPPGGFGSRGKDAGYNEWSLSGVGILALQSLAKGSNSLQIRKGVDFSEKIYKEDPPNWQNNCNLYSWYYYTQAFYQAGGNAWRHWNDTAMAEVLANQNQDGTWKEPGTHAAKSVGNNGAGPDAALYHACLCTLMLEVYYRYLKV